MGAFGMNLKAIEAGAKAITANAAADAVMGSTMTYLGKPLRLCFYCLDKVGNEFKCSCRAPVSKIHPCQNEKGKE